MSPTTRTLILAIVTAAGLWAQNIYNATAIIRDYGPVGSDYFWATGINNSGQVVGEKSDGLHGCTLLGGFLYSGGSFLFTLGGPAAAINDSGQVAGRPGLTANCPGNAYLYSSGLPTYLPDLPGSTGDWSIANAINSSGQVVGYVYRSLSGQDERAFLYSGGLMTALGFLPGGTTSAANGINDSGQIVGYGTNSSGNNEAFLYSRGVMAGLGTLPGYVHSVATAINNSGQIVGYATDASGNTQAFLYSDGVMTALGVLPGQVSSEAVAINKKGQIVGYSGPVAGTFCATCSSSPQRAFLYSGGQMYDLSGLAPSPDGDTLSEAVGINDSGQIAANVAVRSVYLLTPMQGRFVPVAPCRMVDTRTSTGPFGGPALDGVSARSFAIPQSSCGIPATAQAYSLNVTVEPHGPLAYLSLWPSGMAQPHVSTLNSFEGNVVANAAIVPAGQGGAVSAYATNPTDVILDINGYFDASAGDSFYPVSPCRVEDTRRAIGPLGGPAFGVGETRNIPVPTSPCGLPATASAYSMNATVVPNGTWDSSRHGRRGSPSPSLPR